MKSFKEFRRVFPAMTGIMALILDGSTAINGARAGLELCLFTVIPSLFPFIFLSSLLTQSLLTVNFMNQRYICRLLRLPPGGEGILFTGILGGYPVGAKCIGEAVMRKQLTQQQAKKMLIFCNAAGPSFLFGLIGTLFAEKWVPWGLWGIQLLSCVLIARLFPARGEGVLGFQSPVRQSVSQRLRQSLQVMAEICGWIIIMRCFLALLQKWFLWRLSMPLQVVIVGFIELSNGCLSLAGISNTGLRFILCAVFLSFGGLCVALQTVSAAPEVDHSLYIPGKLMQAMLSFIVAYIVQSFAFKKDETVYLPWVLVLALFIALVVFVYMKCKRKNSCGNLESISV